MPPQSPRVPRTPHTAARGSLWGKDTIGTFTMLVWNHSTEVWVSKATRVTVDMRGKGGSKFLAICDGSLSKDEALFDIGQTVIWC